MEAFYRSVSLSVCHGIIWIVRVDFVLCFCCFFGFLIFWGFFIDESYFCC